MIWPNSFLVFPEWIPLESSLSILEHSFRPSYLLCEPPRSAWGLQSCKKGPRGMLKQLPRRLRHLCVQPFGGNATKCVARGSVLQRGLRIRPPTPTGLGALAEFFQPVPCSSNRSSCQQRGVLLHLSYCQVSGTEALASAARLSPCAGSRSRARICSPCFTPDMFPQASSGLTKKGLMAYQLVNLSINQSSVRLPVRRSVCV